MIASLPPSSALVTISSRWTNPDQREREETRLWPYYEWNCPGLFVVLCVMHCQCWIYILSDTNGKMLISLLSLPPPWALWCRHHTASVSPWHSSPPGHYWLVSALHWASALTSHWIVLHESSEVIRHLTRHSMFYSSWFTHSRAPDPQTCWYEVIQSSLSYLGSRPPWHLIGPILSLLAHFNNLWSGDINIGQREVDTLRWLSGVTFWLQTHARLCSLIHKFIGWATLICVCFKDFLAAGKLAACRCSDWDVSFLGFGPFSKLSVEQ